MDGLLKRPCVVRLWKNPSAPAADTTAAAKITESIAKANCIEKMNDEGGGVPVTASEKVSNTSKHVSAT